MRFCLGVHRQQIGLLHIGKHQVLLMRYTQFTKAVAIGHISHHIHLRAGCIAGRDAGFFQ